MLTTNSRASLKKRKATTAPDNTAEERVEKIRTEDDNDCHNKSVQSQRRRKKVQQLLRNAERFAFEKKYELVKRLMKVGIKTTEYVRYKNVFKDYASFLYIWCMECKTKLNDKQSMVNGCNHEKKGLVQCTAADYQLLKCENVYNSDKADWGNVSSRYAGCKQ
jgi:hypothetical protein